MQKPLVSVILTAYNAEKFIMPTIQSVIEQSFPDFEFIIIDDYSADKTVDIISGFKDSRITLIRKNENKGLSGYVENLNHLLEKSEGKYIARIDHDDIWHKEKLEKQIKFLEENPEIGLIGCSRANKIDADGNKIGTLNLLPEDENFKKHIVKMNPIINPTVVFRKEIQTRYRWKLFFCEDYDFHLINFSRNVRYHISDEILIDYRILPGSMSHNKKTLERALFVNQAKKFYRERRDSNGKDSYDIFNPEEILNIRNLAHHTNYSLLKDALKVSFIANLEEDFRMIYKKLKQNYGYRQIPFIYKLFALNFSLFNKVYRLR